ncbi:MAG: hypothetical protein GX827_04800 [Clostridiales bacterium]|nr:hypothetical protein [Clostridiales bacterium]
MIDIKELINEYPYRIELHAHTNPVSGCSEFPPDELAQIYHEKNVDCLCVTNHYTPGMLQNGRSRSESVREFMEAYEKTKSFGKKLGMNVCLGAELRFSPNNNDYLIFGIDEADCDAFYDYLPGSVEDFCREYKKTQHFFLQAHPFRDGMVRIDPSLLDGVEVFNMHLNHRSRNPLAAEWAVDNSLIPTIGSDCHHPGHQATGLIRAKQLPENSADIASLLFSKEFLFEINGFIIIPNFGA